MEQEAKAGFWLRVAALTIDEIILVTFTFILLQLMSLALGFEYQRHIVASLLIYEAIDYNYYTLFWLLCRQTPGKMVLRIKIFKMDGSSLTYADVFIRYWTWMLGVALAGIGYFSIAFHKDKQGWNDLAAKTYVSKIC